MPRKLRLEYPGACYHVINRGNYRADVFVSKGARDAFEACLFETCEKSGWRLHAFVIMRNHFHLAVETPRGNLVAGMQWLQSTYANRFNKLRGERGHLFQGRYKALLVEPGEALGQVCHYIHLNPVRAGVGPVEQLGEFRHSSYWYLFRPKARRAFMCPETALLEAGGLGDTPRGRRCYSDYLAWQAAEGPVGKNKAYVSLSKGWVLGTAGFKSALLEDHAVAAESRAWAEGGAQEVRQSQWQTQLERALRQLGKTAAEASDDLKSAPWKVAIAAYLKQTTQATNRWIAEQLHMGTPVSVSQLVSLTRSRPSPARKLLRSLTENIKA